MIKYKTGSVKWGVEAEIKEVEVVRESESSVWLTVYHHEKKEAEYHHYHDTWDDAHAFLMAQSESKIKQAEMALRRALEARDAVMAMREPGED